MELEPGGEVHGRMYVTGGKCPRTVRIAAVKIAIA